MTKYYVIMRNKQAILTTDNKDLVRTNCERLPNGKYKDLKIFDSLHEAEKFRKENE